MQFHVTELVCMCKYDQVLFYISRTVSELLLSSDFDVNHRIGGKRTLLHIAAKYAFLRLLYAFVRVVELFDIVIFLRSLNY